MVTVLNIAPPMAIATGMRWRRGKLPAPLTLGTAGTLAEQPMPDKRGIVVQRRQERLQLLGTGTHTNNPGGAPMRISILLAIA